MVNSEHNQDHNCMVVCWCLVMDMLLFILMLTFILILFKLCPKMVSIGVFMFKESSPTPAKGPAT